MSSLDLLGFWVVLFFFSLRRLPSRGVSLVGGCFKQSYEAFLSTAAH